MKYAAAVAALTAFLAFASPAHAERIEVTTRVSKVNRQPLPPTGRAGDLESAQWLIRDRYGAAIGDLAIDCRWVISSLRLCVGQLALPLGSVVVAGASRTRFLGQLAIVGGTGNYVGADGTMVFRATGSGAYVLSLHYDLDDK